MPVVISSNAKRHPRVTGTAPEVRRLHLPGTSPESISFRFPPPLQRRPKGGGGASEPCPSVLPSRASSQIKPTRNGCLRALCIQVNLFPSEWPFSCMSFHNACADAVERMQRDNWKLSNSTTPVGCVCLLFTCFCLLKQIAWKIVKGWFCLAVIREKICMDYNVECSHLALLRNQEHVPSPLWKGSRQASCSFQWPQVGHADHTVNFHSLPITHIQAQNAVYSEGILGSDLDVL